MFITLTSSKVTDEQARNLLSTREGYPLIYVFNEKSG
jgi:hypothetical protein